MYKSPVYFKHEKDIVTADVGDSYEFDVIRDYCFDLQSK